MDMARVSLALVVLGHKRNRHPLERSDLLGPVLVDRVLVGRPEGVRVAVIDLVLAEVALALRVLAEHPRGFHAVADAPDQRLHARGAEERVVDVVKVRGLELAVALVPGLLVGVAEDDELELGSGVCYPASLREARELALQNLTGRD